MNPKCFSWTIRVKKKKKTLFKPHTNSIHAAWKHHKNHMFGLGNISVSTYVHEINHINFKVIFISVINCSQQYKLRGEQRFSLLIRQELISSQAACVLKQSTEAWKPKHMCTVRAPHSRSNKNRTTTFKSILPWLTETFNQTCKHA